MLSDWRGGREQNLEVKLLRVDFKGRSLAAPRSLCFRPPAPRLASLVQELLKVIILTFQQHTSPSTHLLLPTSLPFESPPATSHSPKLVHFVKSGELTNTPLPPPSPSSRTGDGSDGQLGRFCGGWSTCGMPKVCREGRNADPTLGSLLPFPSSTSPQS